MSPGGSRKEIHEVVDGAARVPADAPDDAGRGDRARRDERSGSEEPPALEGSHLAEDLALPDRKTHVALGHDTLGQRPVDTHRAHERLLRDELERRSSVADPDAGVDPSPLDERHGPVAGQAPAEQRREVAVPLRTRRAAEHRRVDREAARPHGPDLAPAGGAGVAGLDPDQAGEGAEEVVPGVEDAAADDRRRPLPDDP